MRRRGICDERVLAAFARVPRHRFVPLESQALAYQDYPLPIGFGQTISQPYMVALMTELLELRGEERVLEVGTGSGYQAAVLGELCREVVTMERFADLADSARALLRDLGYLNVEVVVGDGTHGHAQGAPYDAVLVAAAAPRVARAWVEQLVDGGRLVAPVGERWGQVLTRITKRGEGTEHETFGGCAFVPLVGDHGWRDV